jgi:hypothetical protein
MWWGYRVRAILCMPPHHWGLRQSRQLSVFVSFYQSPRKLNLNP